MPHATAIEDGRSRGIPQITDEPWDDPRSLSTFSTFRQLNGQCPNGSRNAVSYPESETSFTESTSSVSSSPQQETSSPHNSGNESISQEETVEPTVKKSYVSDAPVPDIVPKESNSYKCVDDGKDADDEEKNGTNIHSSDQSESNSNTNGKTTDSSDNTGEKEGPEEKENCFLLSISLGRNDRRFGFSVIGGCDEGFAPKIEQITTGSPADRADLEVGDEILEVNGKSLDNCNHKEVISHIHQCIRSRTICLRVKRKTSCKLALDLSRNSNVQDAFVIAVEQQARERLEKLSALKKIKPVDMTKLSQELNECSQGKPELNGVIENNPIYVTTVPEIHNATLERIKKDQLSRSNGQVHDSGVKGDTKSSRLIGSQPIADNDQELELKQEILDSQDLGDETLSLSSPETPPRERLLIEPPRLDSSVHFTQNCVSIETLLPTFPDKSRSSETLITGTNGKAPAMEHEFRQHREMAVDVPDSFVGVSKTTPRYPPPKSFDNDPIKGKKDLSDSVPANDEAKQSQMDVVNNSVNKQMHGVTSKNKFVPESNGVLLCDRTIDNTDKDQIERIRKYQDDIKRRKEAEDRQAREDDFLRTSLRGSKKLQALENMPPQPPKRGVINTAFDLDEQRKSQLPPSAEADSAETPELLQTYGASDLLQSLYRLKNSLQGNGPKDADLFLLEGLIRNKDFQNILTVHNKVQEVCCFKCPPTPTCADAEDSVQEVLNVLQGFPIPEAVELSDILTKFEFEGLMFSHDKIAERQSVPAVTPDEELLDRASHYTEGSVKIVKIDKTNEPLGATVRNEGEAVVIGRIVKGGAAEKSGLLHEGDEILEVNGVEMRGKSVNDVCDILATMAGTLTFLIVPAQYESCRSLSRDVVTHVKAHFDYDPDDDLYIPCRELGISFQKGDILHIINQEDPNWWQAYREGEEDQALAGLVPSKAFQQQRESMKQAIVGETNSKEKSKKAKFLCAKKYNKKKKKKVMYSANLTDEFDGEPVLTYEEVALYYPRANRKRPVVLIGPPNIGRHEVRQRLMEDTERFAAAVPHTSRSKRDPEVDGVDYHFITRSQFEADIMGGKFVEHGEYEKNYYGTSLDAIRAVVNSGKICVLNLHPQSLKILKSSDLKPYVVFVAPPSLEKLRQNRMRNGDYVKDDELKDIIEKAREMEDSYGHFFDMVIINSDIDKAYNELLKEINTLEREPQWVPSAWLKSDCN